MVSNFRFSCLFACLTRLFIENGLKTGKLSQTIVNWPSRSLPCRCDQTSPRFCYFCCRSPSSHHMQPGRLGVPQSRTSQWSGRACRCGKVGRLPFLLRVETQHVENRNSQTFLKSPCCTCCAVVDRRIPRHFNKLSLQKSLSKSSPKLCCCLSCCLSDRSRAQF